LDRKTAQEISSTAATIAEAEGLDAHKNASLIRLKESL